MLPLNTKPAICYLWKNNRLMIITTPHTMNTLPQVNVKTPRRDSNHVSMAIRPKPAPSISATKSVIPKALIIFPLLIGRVCKDRTCCLLLPKQADYQFSLYPFIYCNRRFYLCNELTRHHVYRRNNTAYIADYKLLLARKL